MAQQDLPGSLLSSLSTEMGLVEVPAIDLMASLGWSTANLLHEAPGPQNPTGRLSLKNPFLPARLLAALRKINPKLSEQTLQDAIDVLTEDRSAMLSVARPGGPHRLLRDGVAVHLRQPDGSVKDDRARLIDWVTPANNDFFLGSQVWIASNLYKRRPDTVGFVNGIPLLLMEWKP